MNVMQSQNSLLKDDLLSWPITGDLSVFNVLACAFVEGILQLCTAKAGPTQSCKM